MAACSHAVLLTSVSYQPGPQNNWITYGPLRSHRVWDD